MRIRSLLFVAFLSLILFPVFASSYENGFPITEIEQPGHDHPIALEPKFHSRPWSPIPIPRIPPIIQEHNGLMGVMGGPSAMDNKAITTANSISNGSVPMGNVTAVPSQTEKLLKMLEGVVKKLK